MFYDRSSLFYSKTDGDMKDACKDVVSISWAERSICFLLEMLLVYKYNLAMSGMVTISSWGER